MKILMLTPYLPYPLISGGQIRTYNLLKNLSKDHQITLFALIKTEKEKQYIKELEPLCTQIQLFKRTQNPWAIRNILMAAFTAYPFLVTRNLPKGMRRAVSHELTHHHYDLIHAETFYMMPNIPNTQVPVLLVEQTIEYLGYQFYAQTTPHKFLKPLLYLDIAKIQYWEKHFWRKAGHLVTMSAQDKSYIQSQIGTGTKIDVVANGVDMDFFNKTKKTLPANPTILFVGTFKWLPNIDAVINLIKNLWPGIKAKVPNARLWIVGHSPTPAILELADQAGITISSDIADIREAYAKAHVLLAPIRSGKGTRYKILEAMATGTPIVTTRLGAEGIDLVPGENALIGDTSEELINLTAKVLTNQKLQLKLAKAAKNVVVGKYTWQSISTDLDKLYRKMARKKY
jgi:glycosyltransferase involved in cell wall biosynthesis